jgi:hypothetical protein
MIGAAAPQRIPVEITRDPRFGRRIRRLTVVSAVALGMIWFMAVTTLEAPLAVDSILAAGWLLMPSTLVASLLHPQLRYGLVAPASLVSIGLLAVCLGWLPVDPVVALGWLLMTAGVALGGGLGLWFWYRPLPVPARLDDPFSPGRWGLIAVHVTLVVTGFVLAAQALWD